MKAIRNILVGLALVSSAAAYAYDMPATMYLVGDATPAGWNSGDPYPMTKVENNTFVWEGNLYHNGSAEMKFLVGKDWNPAVYAPDFGTEISTEATQVFTVTYGGGDDKKWVVEQDGYYRLTLALDPTKADNEAGTLTVNYLGGKKAELYKYGQIADRWESIFYGENGVFSWTGDIFFGGEDKQFKFSLTQGAWDQITYLVPTEVNYNGNVQQIESGTYSYMESAETEPGALKDWFWGIYAGKSGKYTVTVNTNEKTVSLELVELYSFDRNNVNELYMLGLGANSFDSNNPLKMTAIGDGKFQWKGSLDYDTNDGNPEHPNKQFKFVTGTGAWDKVNYLVPAAADSDGYIEQLEPGEYDMKPCTWLDGQTGVDAFYGLKPGMKDNYIVTADVPNMKVKLERDTTTGVGEIAVEAEGAEEVYDLAGRRVDLDNAPAGIYIVRKDGETRKVAIR